MPTTYTHYKLGCAIQKKVSGYEKEIIDKYPELFFIGLHGPDILFYYKPLTKHYVNRLGVRLHEEAGADFFERAAGVIKKQKDYEKHLAYIYGFICHFALDVTCHGYIDEKIARSGISHGEIEAEMDRELLVLDGKDPVRETLTNHIHVSMKNAVVIKDFFEGVTGEQVKKSLDGMLFYHKVLRAPSRVKRLILALGMKAAGVYDSMYGMIINYKKNPECADSTRKLLELFKEATPLALRLIEEYRPYLEGKMPLDGIYRYNFSTQLRGGEDAQPYPSEGSAAVQKQGK